MPLYEWLTDHIYTRVYRILSSNNALQNEGMEVSSLIDELPDNVYIKLINYLSVNDIENLSESGLDSRTNMAFDNLEHAVIYQTEVVKPNAGLISWWRSESSDETKLHQWLSKLPKSVKTIEVCHRDHAVQWMDIEALAKNYPNLEELPSCYDVSLLEYIKNINHSKLKYILLNNSRFADLIEQQELLRVMPELKILELVACKGFNFEHLSRIRDTCTKLEKMNLRVYDLNEEEYVQMKKYFRMPSSLKVLLIYNRLGRGHDVAFQGFLTFCTKQSYRTQLKISDRLSLPDEFCELIIAVDVYRRLCHWTHKLEAMSNLRFVQLICHVEDIELLCDTKLLPTVERMNLTLYVTMNSGDSLRLLEKVVQARGHQLCAITIQGIIEFSPLVDAFLNANLTLNDFKVVIENYVDMITVDDIERLYQVSVQRLLHLQFSDTLVIGSRVEKLIEKASANVRNKKCSIVSSICRVEIHF